MAGEHIISKRMFVSATSQQAQDSNTLSHAARFARSRKFRFYICLPCLLVLINLYLYNLNLRFPSTTSTSSSRDEKHIDNQKPIARPNEMNVTTLEVVDITRSNQVESTTSKEVKVTSDVQNDDSAQKAHHAQATRLKRHELNEIILSTAKVMDLQYQDVTGGLQDHPHRGALDEFGKSGYIYDEKALHKNPVPLNISIEDLKCNDKTDLITRIFREKVFIDHTAVLAKKGNGTIGTNSQKIKLLCLVYTAEPYHDRIPAIRET